VGDRSRITSDLFDGEAATVESAAGGVISSAMVRTESGRTRRARTIDLEPISATDAVAAAPDEASPQA
jgi:hypothetical protein